MLALFLALSFAADPEAAFARAEEFNAKDRPGRAEPLYLEALNSTQPFTRRRAYERLLGLYVKSGRQDKAVRLADPFRAWLVEVKDAATTVELDLILAECYLGLGHLDTARGLFAKAVTATPPLPTDRRLQARRGLAEVAVLARDPEVTARWAELERDAAAVRAGGETFPTRLLATRYVAEALHARGRTAAAADILTEPLAKLDAADEPLARRDLLRLLANLRATAGQYAAAAGHYREAVALHRRAKPAKRSEAGDMLAEWAAAAAAAERKADAAKLRDEAAAEYRAVLMDPAVAEADGSGTVAAFVKLQVLTRAAKQFQKALVLTQEASERWQGDTLLDARLKADRGALELIATTYKAARGPLAAALAQLRAADPPDLKMLPQVLVNLAAAELAADSPEAAGPLLIDCAALYPKYGLPPDPVRAECDYLRGAAAAQAGDYAAAMRHFQDGLRTCDAVGPAAEPVRFNLNLNAALIYKEQGEADLAAAALEQAAKSLAAFADPGDLNFGLIDAVRADLYVSIGRLPDAVKLVAHIEAACDANGVRGGYLWTTARHVRGLDALAKRDLPAAVGYWTELADRQRAEKHVLLPRTLNFLGIANEVRGNPKDAEKYFREAKAELAIRPRANPVTRAITFWRLAALTDAAGRGTEALSLLDEVFAVADAARLNTFGEAAQRAAFFAQFTPAFDLHARILARAGDGDALLVSITRTRSRTLHDQILAAGVDPRANLLGPEHRPLLDRETAARKAVSRIRAKVQFFPADRVETPEGKKLIAEFEAAQAEYAAAWREIVNADPLTRNLTDADFAGKAMAAVRKQVLGPKSAVLAYLIGRDESFAVVLSNPAAKAEVVRLTVPKEIAETTLDVPPQVLAAAVGLRGVVLKPLAPQPAAPAAPPPGEVPLTAAVATRLVDHYLLQMNDQEYKLGRGIVIVSRSPGEPRKATRAATLGDALLPPAVLEKLAGADRVVIVPDGAVHKLPVECLELTTPAGPRFALDVLPPTAYTPNPAVLALTAGRPRDRTGPPSLLTVADPAYPPGTAEGRLPESAAESKRVRGFFPPDRVVALEQQAATKANVLAHAAGKRYLHFAAHGYADTRFGNLFAAVALAPPPAGSKDGGDGHLSLYEIYRLPLAGCDLTVLSACVTNVGPQRPLEAGVTLAGGFLAAGSRGVLATCWSVADEATAELISEFFRSADPASDRGLPYAVALHRARQKIRSTAGWEAPFFWAPFVYLGPPD